MLELEIQILVTGEGAVELKEVSVKTNVTAEKWYLFLKTIVRAAAHEKKLFLDVIKKPVNAHFYKNNTNNLLINIFIINNLKIITK